MKRPPAEMGALADLLPGAQQWVAQRATELFVHDHARNVQRTDRMFAALLGIQWLAAIVMALLLSPYTYMGTLAEVHVHVYLAVLFGGLLNSLPWYLAWRHPGRPQARLVMAVAQMIWVGLLIHLTGGRIESHFHVFGSLAFLAVYRDPHVILCATAVTALDHLVRGLYWPESVYGIANPAWWRFLEHVAWVVVEDVWLLIACRNHLRDMRAVALRQAEVEVRTEALAQKNAAAAAHRMKVDFFNNVSHELRTPLTLVLGPLEDLSRGQLGPLNAAQTDHLQLAWRHAQRLLRLVNDLLEVARYDAVIQKQHPTPVDLGRLTADIARGFDAAVRRAGMQLQIDCPPLAEDVNVSVDMWEKVVSNLLSNALKYSQQGTIHIEQRLQERTVTLRVRDTGIGIAAADLPHIFERFMRVSAAPQQPGASSGIGLAVVQQIVGQLGGRIEVSSTLGQGSEFCVSLPLGGAPVADDRAGAAGAQLAPAQPAAAPEVLASAAQSPSPAPVPAGQAAAESAMPQPQGQPRRRILVVEDSPDLRAYICQSLRKHYDVTEAAEGALALRLAQAQSPDLVVSDLTMPGMDGMALLAALRQHATLCAVPVILLTARSGEDDRVQAIGLGADDYLTKPFSPRELLARVGTQISLCNMRRQAAEQQATAAYVAELQRLLQARDAFLCIASHELNTPLTTLVLQLGLFTRKLRQVGKEGITEARLDKFVSHTQRQIDRLIRLVADMLDVSRLDAQTMVLRPSTFDLNDMVREVVHSLEAEFAQAQMAVACHLGPPLVGQWDRTRLEQVLLNLLINAIRYSGSSTVDVEVQAAAHGASLILSDRGCGIPEADQQRIFERFERATPRSEQSGLGLGLYICKEIVGLHGGTLALHSRPQRGTRFTLTLPLQAALAGEARAAVRP